VCVRTWAAVIVVIGSGDPLSPYSSPVSTRKLPHPRLTGRGRGETLAHALWQQWPSYVAYLVSFLTIGVIWLNHHRVFTQVIGVDGPLLVLNLNVLLWTGLIPFPTAVVAQHLRDGGEPARTAAALYCGVLLVMGLAFGALFAWVTHTDRLLGRLPPPGVVRAARRRFMLGLVVYGAALALSWVSAPLAVALCGLMALYYAFDQASLPAAAAPDNQQPTRGSA